MSLKALLVRFFKSFNFDYLRKNYPYAKPSPWEQIGEAWFPFDRIPLNKEITTIVGAKESGKSHSLGAIKKGLSGENISRRDFVGTSNSSPSNIQPLPNGKKLFSSVRKSNQPWTTAAKQTRCDWRFKSSGAITISPNQSPARTSGFRRFRRHLGVCAILPSMPFSMKRWTC